jgi:hypothetical protein
MHRPIVLVNSSTTVYDHLKNYSRVEAEKEGNSTQGEITHEARLRPLSDQLKTDM